MPFLSQQSGYSMPLMVGYVMNESMNPHTGTKGSVKDCGCTHEHTAGRLMKLGGRLMKRQQFSHCELLIQAIFNSPFASHTVCIIIPLHSFSYTDTNSHMHSQRYMCSLK